MCACRIATAASATAGGHGSPCRKEVYAGQHPSSWMPGLNSPCVTAVCWSTCFSIPPEKGAGYATGSLSTKYEVKRAYCWMTTPYGWKTSPCAAVDTWSCWLTWPCVTHTHWVAPSYVTAHYG